MKMREEVKNSSQKQCWMVSHCPCRTAVCYVVPLPDEGCYVYRWFKKLIKEDELVTEQYEIHS
jgi:hypothetical protein